MMRRVVRLVRLVHQHELLQAVKQQKSQHQGNHRDGRIDRMRLRQAERFWNDVKGHHAEQHAGREGQNESKEAGKAQRQQAACKGRAGGDDR